MKEYIGNPEDNIVLTLEGQLNRMWKLREIISDGIGRKSDDFADDEPRAIDMQEQINSFNDSLKRFVIKSSPDLNISRKVNLALDPKLSIWREVKGDGKSLCLLMIGSTLRNEGVVDLEKVYEKTEAAAGGQKIDPKLFREAWDEIKALAEEPNK